MVDALITPKGQLDLLTRTELELLRSSSDNTYRTLFRNCALAVLSAGADGDEGHELLARHQDFDIELVSTCRGVKLKLSNAPENAFVDGEIIMGIRSHLFSVLRDIVYLRDQVKIWEAHGETITDMVFKMLRNARALQPRKRPNLVVCWGGHSINTIEYDYSKEVGYRLGLRGMDICTGCGIGAMKGPMKGATIAHAKQRITHSRYIGISEPGGAGTAEEILYLLGILLHEQNQGIKLPVVFTGPKESEAYFTSMSDFITRTLGEQATSLYEIVIDDSIKVSQIMARGMRRVEKNRRKLDDAYFFNWSLHIDSEFQAAFKPTHENMSGLNLSFDQPKDRLAADLRRAFSGIVAGNIKPDGISAIQDHGPYQLTGDPKIMAAMDTLLSEFVAQRRMKLKGVYQPCYELVH
mgnify:CR=1 FL=1